MAGRRFPAKTLRAAALALLVASSVVSGPGAVQAEPTRLDAIRARGFVACGIPEHSVAGFAVVGPGAQAEGFDVDFCRALGAAIFGERDRIRLVAVATARQFLDASDIDVVFHGLTWNFSRELTSGLAFAPPSFYDGQAFLARRGRGTLRERQPGRICVEIGSPFASTLMAYLEANRLDFTVNPIAGKAGPPAAFFDNACDILTADASMLFAAAAGHGDGYEILPERISKEPLTAVVRKGDDTLLAVLRWVIFATIAAEEIGLTASNVDDLPADRAPAADLFDLPAAQAIGLSPAWAAQVVKAVGNYGEIYDRNFQRPGDALMPRGQNDLWTRGGLLYAPPLR